MFSFLATLFKRIKPDRRRERRAQLRAKASFGTIKGVVVDLSLGGCGFYPHDEGLEVGQEALLTLDFGVEVMHIPSKISAKDDEGLIYGIAFREVSPANFEILNDMLVSRVVAHDDEANKVRTAGL